MQDEEVCRYLKLVNRRFFILLHSGTSWKPEYGPELEAIDKELAGLWVMIDREHEEAVQW